MNLFLRTPTDGEVRFAPRRLQNNQQGWNYVEGKIKTQKCKACSAGTHTLTIHNNFCIWPCQLCLRGTTHANIFANNSRIFLSHCMQRRRQRRRQEHRNGLRIVPAAATQKNLQPPECNKERERERA